MSDQFDLLEQSEAHREQSARRPAADTRPEPGLLEQAGAAVSTQFDTLPVTRNVRIEQAFADIEDALIERGLDPTQWRTPAEVQTRQFGSLTYEQIRESRAKLWRLAQENGIEGLPATQAEYERQVQRREGGRDADLDVMARGEGLNSTVAQFLGSMVGGLPDPVNLVSTFASAGTGGLVRRALTEGAVNMGIEAVLATGQTPAAYEALGEDYTTGDAMRDVAMAGAAGVAVRGTLDLAPAAGRAAMRPLAPLRQRVADFNRVRDMARALDSGELPEGLAPEQEAALRILRRQDEIDGASPYPRTIEGDDLHQTRLEQALADIANGRAPREFGPADFEAAKRAIRGPESGGDDAARNRAGSSASGRYQFIQSTFVSLYREEYGASDAAARAAWQSNRFDVNVQERLMDRLLRHNAATLQRNGQEASTGNLYLAHFAGAGRAARLLRAPPDAPVSRYFTPVEIAQNSTYLGGGKSVSEAIAIIHAKVGNSPPSTPRPAQPDPFAGADDAASAELARISEEEAQLAIARAEAQRQMAEMSRAVRPLLREPAVELNDIDALAGEMEVDPAALRRALTDMGLSGELELVLPQRQRGRVKASANRWRWQTNEEVAAANDGIWPGTFRRNRARAAEDALAFISRGGGLSYDGLSAGGRKLGTAGHDLRNSGNLDHFVPGSGPLLRPDGRGLDEVGEELWDAGYFGPPSVTPRPTEGELITWLDDIIRKGEKVYLPENAPAPKAPTRADLEGPPPDADEAALQAEQFWAMVDRVGDVAQDRLRTILLADDVSQIAAMMRVGTETLAPVDPRYVTDPDTIARYVENYVNSRFDEALDNLLLEADDAAYDFPAFTDAASEDGGAQTRGSGSARIAGDTGEGSAGGGTGGAVDRQGLTEAQRDLAGDTRQGPPSNPDTFQMFDDPAGDGAKLAAASDWHDIDAGRQMEQAASQQQLDHAREIARDLNIDRISIDKVGQLGPMIEGLNFRWPDTVRLLSALQSGDARAALWHPDTQMIDVIWGNQNAGLAHILQKHGADIRDNFPDELAAMRVHKKERNRVILRNEQFEAVIELGWKGEPKRWLLTAFRRSGTERSAAVPLADRAAQDPDQSASSNVGEIAENGNGQSDFAAPTPEQARIALERQAEGRMKGTAPQKPAGSDGGLFDANGGRGDTTGDLFGDTFDLGDGRGPRAISDIRSEIDNDRAALDAIRKCME